MDDLRQIAYDAHWSFYDGVSEHPKRWDTHADECDMVAWQAAADAVRDEVVSQAAINEQMYYSSMSPIKDSERDIIEAAREWSEHFYNDASADFREAEQALFAAVEAYEREKG